MSEQELKKSVEAMKNLQNDLTSSKEKALAFLQAEQPLIHGYLD